MDGQALNKMVDPDRIYPNGTNISQEVHVNTTNSSGVSKEDHLLFCVINTCAAFSAIFNSIVLITVKKFKMLHTATNVLFAGLAATNAFFGVTVLCSRITMSMYNPFSRAICAINNFTIAFAICNSLNIISMLTFDRYIAVMKFTEYKSVMTHHRCHQMLLCSFIWAILLAWISALQVPISWQQEVCSLDFLYWKWFSAIIVLHFSLLILPTFFAHAVIFCSLGQLQQQLVTMDQCKRYRAQVKISCLIVTVTAAAVLCYSPQIFYTALIMTNASQYYWLDQARTVALILNPTIQPLLYIFQSGDFRKCFRKIIRPNNVIPVQEEQQQSQVHADHLVFHLTGNM